MTKDKNKIRKQEKRHKIRKKLRDLNYLPEYRQPLNEEQQKIWNQIKNDDFSFWNELKTKIGQNIDDCISCPKKNVHNNKKRLLLRAKENAKEKKMEFNLDIDDIEIPELCPFLNVPLITEFTNRTHPHYYSIDRIDSSKGYVKGNVQVISFLANTMKNNATLEQLKTFAKNILLLYS